MMRCEACGSIFDHDPCCEKNPDVITLAELPINREAIKDLACAAARVSIRANGAESNPLERPTALQHDIERSLIDQDREVRRRFRAGIDVFRMELHDAWHEIKKPGDVRCMFCRAPIVHSAREAAVAVARGVAATSATPRRDEDVRDALLSRADARLAALVEEVRMLRAESRKAP